VGSCWEPSALPMSPQYFLKIFSRSFDTQNRACERGIALHVALRDTQANQRGFPDTHSMDHTTWRCGATKEEVLL
jgi:hypothetical protein